MRIDAHCPRGTGRHLAVLAAMVGLAVTGCGPTAGSGAGAAATAGLATAAPVPCVGTPVESPGDRGAIPLVTPTGATPVGTPGDRGAIPLVTPTSCPPAGG